MSAHLEWEYGYDKLPKALIKRYAGCEVLGPRGAVQTDDLIIGFVMFAPSTTYPQHSHSEIEESYTSIAGSRSENNSAVFSPGSLILNTPGSKHRITTSVIGRRRRGSGCGFRHRPKPHGPSDNQRGPHRHPCQMKRTR
ncbi:MAG: dimethylsulfonioproprionate lyase family protein [Paracoccaceae bacterium]